MRKTVTLFFFSGLFFLAGAQTQVQFINNSADSLMGSVKVLMNGDLKKDSLAYRKATAFISTAGDSTYTIEFQSLLNASKTVSITQSLASGKKYVFVLNGVTNDTVYQKNPDSVSVLLNIVVIDQSSLAIPAGNEVSLGFISGSTDAPSYDLYLTDTLNTQLIDNDSLNQVSGINIGDSMLRFRLKTADGNFTISTFLFSLSGLGGQTTTALTSGFIAPGSNKNGPNFSVYLVDSSGNVINAQNVSLVHNRENIIESLLIYPNPSAGPIALRYLLSENAGLQYAIFSIDGSLLSSGNMHAVNGWNEQLIPLDGFSSGIYFLELKSELAVKTVSFVVK